MTAIQYISQLPAAAAAGATDLIPVTQGSTGPLTGTTRKLTVAQLFTSPTLTGTITLGANLANYVTITGAAAGSDPVIAVAGSDTNIDMVLRAKGSGGLFLGDNLANYATFTGAASGGTFDASAPILTAAGTDTHIDLKALGKGTNGRLHSRKLYVGHASARAFVADETIADFRASIAYGATMRQAFRFGVGASGTVTGGDSEINLLAVDGESIDCTGTSGGSITGWRFAHQINAGAKGGRVGFSAGLFINNAFTSGTSGAGTFQTAAGFRAQASVSAGGSAGFGNQRGWLFGINPIVELKTGAGLYWNGITGGEITLASETGTQVNYKVGFQVVQGNNDAAVGASGVDAGYLLTNGSGASVAAGWDVGYCFGAPWGWWPMKSTGTMIGTGSSLAGGPSYAAAWGVDFSAVTFSSGFLKSNGFEVDSIGRTTGAAFILGSGGPRIVPGTGAPSALLVLTKGSLYLRTDGAVGSTIYVSQGGGTWNAIAGV